MLGGGIVMLLGAVLLWFGFGSVDPIVRGLVALPAFMLGFYGLTLTVQAIVGLRRRSATANPDDPIGPILLGDAVAGAIDGPPSIERGGFIDPPGSIGPPGF